MQSKYPVLIKTCNSEVTQECLFKILNVFSVLDSLEKSTESNEAVINNAWESIYDNMKIAV
jgi:hypothetical protein